MSNFPTIKSHTNKELSDFAYLFIRYCETTFAKQALHELNLEQKIFTISFDNYIICRHNGFGYIMTEGGSAGIWAYVMQDKSIECVQLECQGRGNERCFVICAPEEKLQEKTNKIIRIRDLPEHKFDNTYKKLNEIRKTTYVVNSLKKLIDAGFFTIHEGILSYKDMRFFGCEAHIFYLLEQEITKLQGGEKVLFDACAEFGKILRETYGGSNFQKFIPDFFSALGFGDILIVDSDKLCIMLTYYPWTVLSKQSKFIVLRGILSGIVSSSLGKTIEFNEYNIDVKNFLTLTIRT